MNNCTISNLKGLVNKAHTCLFDRNKVNLNYIDRIAQRQSTRNENQINDETRDKRVGLINR